jgi:diacylglycerol kinase
MKSLLNSFKYAGKGIVKIFRKGKIFKVQLIIFALILIAGFVLHISRLEWLITLLAGGMVLSLEMINTAIESVVDLVTEEFKVLAERIKDIAAGAVLISSLIALIIGLIVFIPHIINIF